jgi:hypothetical protein
MKPKYKLDKRQKELARKQKQDRKKEEKLARKAPPAGAPANDDASPTD